MMCPFFACVYKRRLSGVLTKKSRRSARGRWDVFWRAVADKMVKFAFVWRQHPSGGGAFGRGENKISEKNTEISQKICIKCFTESNLCDKIKRESL